MIFDDELDRDQRSIPQSKPPQLPTETFELEDLVFVGLNGKVAGLHRDTGDMIWSNLSLKGGGNSYVTMMLDGDRLIVSSSGYIYCLDPYDGRVLWHNPMKGFGMCAPTSLVSVRGQSQQVETIEGAAMAAANASAGAAAAS